MEAANSTTPNPGSAGDQATNTGTDSAAPTRHPTEEMDGDHPMLVDAKEEGGNASTAPGKDKSDKDKDSHPPAKKYRLSENLKSLIWQLVLLSNECCRLENEKKCVPFRPLLCVIDVFLTSVVCSQCPRRICVTSQRARAEEGALSEGNSDLIHVRGASENPLLTTPFCHRSSQRSLRGGYLQGRFRGTVRYIYVPLQRRLLI